MINPTGRVAFTPSFPVEVLIKEELGNKWLCNNLFRIGASSLLGDIERQLYHYATGRYAASHEFAMA